MILSDSCVIMADSRIATGGGEADGVAAKFYPNGDTMWTVTYGLPDTDVLMAMDIVGDSGFAFFGSTKSGQYYDMRLIRTDTAGNELWSQTYGGIEDQQCYSGQRTLDGGFILSGFRWFNNDHLNMYVVKVDSLGNQQWDGTYGSPWIDNTGFIWQLPDSGYILAGAQRLSETGFRYPTFYRLDASGDVVWSRVYNELVSGPLYTSPHYVPGEGFAAAGTQKLGALSVGRLMKVDLSGSLLWDRSYQTNTQFDHYFYDSERTLDGGYIMAGTAFDTLLVSQDAWLVKVDSFGCLVPGCQVFDGLEEQFTDLTDALTVYPNPVAAGQALMVQVELPTGFIVKGPLRLAVVSADGRVVAEQPVRNGASSIELSTSGLSSGIYFLHLLDGVRWLSGAKVMVE